MTREEIIHIFENSRLVSEHFDSEAVTAAYIEGLAALREQEERERGCEYCNEDSEGYRKMIGAFSITNPFHGNVWNIETCHCKPRQIYFCPMCGRRLSQQPKGE